MWTASINSFQGEKWTLALKKNQLKTQEPSPIRRSARPFLINWLSPRSSLGPNRVQCACFSSHSLQGPSSVTESGSGLPGSRCHTGSPCPAIFCFPSHFASFPSLQHAIYGEGRAVTKRQQWVSFLCCDVEPTQPVHTGTTEISKYYYLSTPRG